jgi:hypothetical protein
VADHDIRIWGSLTVDDIHQVYVRGRLLFVDWARGDSYNMNDHDTNGPDLDQGWYSFNLSNFMKKYADQKWPVEVKGKVGRQYIEVGRGVALSQIIDAAMLDLSCAWCETQLFGGMNVESTANLDASAPKYWHDERQYLGVQGKLKVFDRHEPYFFVLLVDDKNDYHQVYDDTLLFFDVDGDPIIQGYGYNPNYYGIGSSGYLIPNLRYWGEVIWEGGHSRARDTRKQEEIDGRAIIAGAEYLFNEVPTRPRIETEYGMGSGDPDRESPTNTVNGNQPGSRDRGFLAYGYFDTGVAFAPRLANVRVYRVTTSFHPFDPFGCESLKEFELGASWYWFTKDERGGGVSDFRADQRRFGLGTELDLFANWRICSDLLWTLRWGQFYPGGALTDRSTRGYLLTSVTYSF